MRLPHILVLICCLLLVGCIPVQMQVGKHIEGTVVDQHSGVPIAGAGVMYRRQPSTQVLTDTNGAFTLERQFVKYWRPLLPVDYFGFYHYPVAVQAKGYVSAPWKPTARMEPQSVRIELSPIK